MYVGIAPSVQRLGYVLKTEESRFDLKQEQELSLSLFSPESRPALVSTQPIQWVGYTGWG
jgi:hypothetical protein